MIGMEDTLPLSRPHLTVDLLQERGYYEALYGLSLSFKDRAIPFEEWMTADRIPKLKQRAEQLAPLDGGHNKFLESMVVWLDIEAPRYWWQEFDTYRIGVTKQSESTMHTASRRELTFSDFEEGSIIIPTLRELNLRIRQNHQVERIKSMLPEGFLQRRVVVLNYKALRNIILQRRNHRLPHWKMFIANVLKQVAHKELLPGLND
jgi:hypothetical protein